MADTGQLSYSSILEGAFIELDGADEDPRVYLGPARRDFPAGEVTVYRSRTPLATLSAVDDREGDVGRLTLGNRDNRLDPQLVATPTRLSIERDTPAREGGPPMFRLPWVNDGKSRVSVGVGDHGGYLYVQGPDRAVTIDQNGIQVRNSKVGFSSDFVVEHPGDPSREIHYSVVEGPEAGVCVRGSARLV